MAKEYIDREMAIEAIKNDLPNIVNYRKADAIECLGILPAADVAEVRRGRWIPYEVEERFENTGNPYHNYLKYEPLSYRCSLCGRIEERKEPYCHCGAKMDGKGDKG